MWCIMLLKILCKITTKIILLPMYKIYAKQEKKLVNYKLCVLVLFPLYMYRVILNIVLTDGGARPMPRISPGVSAERFLFIIYFHNTVKPQWNLGKTDNFGIAKIIRLTDILMSGSTVFYSIVHKTTILF